MSRKLSGLNDKESLIRRLKRIEGQVKGIANMVENDRYCVDILVQIAAVKSAVESVGNIILENHIKGCVTDHIKNPDSDDDEIIEELMKIIKKFSK